MNGTNGRIIARERPAAEHAAGALPVGGLDGQPHPELLQGDLTAERNPAYEERLSLSPSATPSARGVGCELQFAISAYGTPAQLKTRLRHPELPSGADPELLAKDRVARPGVAAGESDTDHG